MAGTIVVDRIESDSSYTSTINVASKVNFTGGMQIGGQDTTFGGMRNRIINGAMMIDQRSNAASVSWSTGYGYTLDRYFTYNSGGGGVYSVQQVSDAPTGFTKSLKVTVTTADSSLATSDLYFLQQKIEGFNVADLAWGSASAQPVTLSFWVKSSVTGSFPVTLIDGAGGNNYRTYGVSYTVLQANTWEYKTVTIPGETAGSFWFKDNQIGIQVSWGLGAGSQYTISSGSWVTSKEGYQITGNNNLISNLNATWQITGVQLEKGSSATPFEHRMYGQELALCQRYYQQIGKSNNTAYLPYAVGNGVSGTQASIILNYPVMMRTNPSFTFTGATNTFLLSGIPVTAVASDIMGVSNCMYTVSVSSGMSSGAGARHYQNNQAASSLELSAEL
jgi:hypothetical protein